VFGKPDRRCDVDAIALVKVAAESAGSLRSQSGAMAGRQAEARGTSEDDLLLSVRKILSPSLLPFGLVRM
jgi:hypothetical protein